MHDEWASQKPATMRVIAALMACGGMTFADPSANAQVTVPCRYEVAHIIQGPICPITQQPALTVGTAISPSGRYVCGYYRLCGPSEDSPFVFDTTTQAFFTIPLPSGFYAASCADVNDAGLVVGTALRTNVGQRGFIYRMETGEWTELLPQPGGVWSAATGVNSSDTVCGWRSIGPGTHPQTAFRWTLQSGFEDLGLINGLSTSASDLNDAANYCGWRGNSASSSNARGILWSAGVVTELPPIPGGSSSACVALNNLGVSCGHGLYPGASGNDVHAFVWSDGTMTDLGVIEGFLRSFALDISDKNEIVGYCRTLTNGSDARRAYVWQNGEMRELNTLVPSLPTSMEIAWAIDSQGQIVAQAALTTYVLTPVFGNAGDVNLDCQTNVLDMLFVIDEWSESDSPADLNSDGSVNVADLLIVISNWSFK